MNDIIKASIIRLYQSGRLNDAELEAAVKRGWITQAEADEIKAGTI